MAQPPTAWAFYNELHLWLADGTFDLATDTFKMALFTSASNYATQSLALYGDLTSELANGSGYTTGGLTLAGVTWTLTGGVASFTSLPALWLATGTLTFRAAVIYKSGTANGHVNPLVCFSTLDGTPADITVATGTPFAVAANAQGIFTLSG